MNMKQVQFGNLEEKASRFRASNEKGADSATMIESLVEKFLRRPAPHLGDRSTYIGSSDICERKAVLSRLKGENFSLSDLLRFQRGRFWEDLMASALKEGGIEFEREAEFEHPERPHMKCHVDFLMIRDTPRKMTVGIIETKASADRVYSVSDLWLEQLQQQMGLVRLHFDKAMNKPVEVKGCIACLSGYDDKLSIFTGYQPSEESFSAIEMRVDRIWNACQQGESGLEKTYTRQSPFCAMCSFIPDCPAHTNISGAKNLEGIADEIQRYLEGRRLEAEGKKIKDNAKNVIDGYMADALKGELAGLAKVTKSTTKTKEEIDTEALVQFLEEFQPGILARFKKTKPGHNRLTVTAIKSKAA